MSDRKKQRIKGRVEHVSFVPQWEMVVLQIRETFPRRFQINLTGDNLTWDGKVIPSFQALLTLLASTPTEVDFEIDAGAYVTVESAEFTTCTTQEQSPESRSALLATMGFLP